jgi:hypothetical protein
MCGTSQEDGRQAQISMQPGDQHDKGFQQRFLFSFFFQVAKIFYNTLVICLGYFSFHIFNISLLIPKIP